MGDIYEAIITGDRIDWTGAAPVTKEPLHVQVTVLREDAAARGTEMAAALKQLAQQGGLAEIEDPLTWQQETRRERSRPGETDAA